MRTRFPIAVGVTLVLLYCLPAAANTGLPMIIPSLVYMVPALPLIAGIEAIVASNLANVRFRRAFLVALKANLLSTFIGIPLTWIGLLAIQAASGGGRAYGLDTFALRLLAVTWQSPWLIPYRGALDWMVPAAMLFLLLPYFFVSVWIERWSSLRSLADCDAVQVSKAVVAGNIGSYSLLLLVFVVQLIYALMQVVPPPAAAL